MHDARQKRLSCTIARLLRDLLSSPTLDLITDY